MQSGRKLTACHRTSLRMLHEWCQSSIGRRHVVFVVKLYSNPVMTRPTARCAPSKVSICKKRKQLRLMLCSVVGLDKVQMRGVSLSVSDVTKMPLPCPHYPYVLENRSLSFRLSSTSDLAKYIRETSLRRSICSLNY